MAVTEMAEKVLSQSFPPGMSDRTWGVLSAISEPAKQRAQGQHILLTQSEHTLGRAVKDANFMFDAPSISGRHCRIFRKSSGAEGNEIVVYLKDSSSNGTFINGQKLRKDSPEHALAHGDIISLATVPELETGFVYVYRDHDAMSGPLKRKLEDDSSRNDEMKRMKVSVPGLNDGPVSLADVRRLERSNQELRQKLESECNKCDGLNTALREAKSGTDLLVKEAVEQCIAEYTQKLTAKQAELLAKASELEECSSRCIQQQSVIDDLNKRLKAAAQSRIEVEDALKNQKVSREQLENQLEKERNQWKSERDEVESLHKSALDRVRAEAAEDFRRQGEAFFRQQKQLEEKLSALEDSKRNERAQIENLQEKLETERNNCMNFERQTQELQNLLNSEQSASAALRQENEKGKYEFGKACQKLEECMEELRAANAKIASLQLDKEATLNELKLERQRVEGARERILLRETQLRAFQTTAEEISVLQQKQQVQLRTMMKTLEDDEQYAKGNFYRDGDEEQCSESKTVNEEVDDMEVTKVDGTVTPTPTTATCPNGLPEPGEQTSGYKETAKDDEETQLQLDEPQLAPTQVDATQLDCTQLLPADAREDNNTDEGDTLQQTQLAEEEEHPVPTRNFSNAAPEAKQKSGGRSLCTADLLTSEAAGSWVNDTQDGEAFNRDEVQNQVTEFPGSQVATSDSEQQRLRLSLTLSQNYRVNDDAVGSQNISKANKLQPKAAYNQDYTDDTDDGSEDDMEDDR